MPKRPSSKVPFNFLSATRCYDCGKPIKRNLINRKRDRVLFRCYKCHILSEARSGHNMMGLPGLKPAPTFKRIPVIL